MTFPSLFNLNKVIIHLLITLELSELNCTERTVCECALKTPVLPVTVGIHNRTLLSLEAEAIYLPDGENVTSITASL